MARSRAGQHSQQPDPDLSLGQVIRQARLARALTQRELAAQLGVAYQTLALWEKDQAAPLPRRMRLLSEVLELDLADLMRRLPDGVSWRLAE